MSPDSRKLMVTDENRLLMLRGVNILKRTQHTAKGGKGLASP